MSGAEEAPGFGNEVALGADPGALEPALDRMRLKGSVYCLFEGGEGFGLHIPQAAEARFHAVRSGSCWLRVEGEPAIHIAAGELILLPHGDAHDVVAEEGSPLINLTDAFAGADPYERVFRLGDGERVASMICGGFDFRGQRYPIKDCLPRFVRLRIDHPGAALLGNVLDVAESELLAPHLASDVVLGRLSEILFVAAVRTYSEMLPEGRRGWLGAVRDRTVGAALSAIHRRPHEDWTVSRLARHAGVSRTTLNERFREFLDDTPNRYLRRWRLFVAADLLRETELGIGEVAARVGYASEAAFSRAFRRQFSRWPTEHRAASGS